MLVECVKDNYYMNYYMYAKFHDPRYHRYRETQFCILLDMNI